MNLIDSNNDVIATGDSITWVSAQQGWDVDGVIYADPTRQWSAVTAPAAVRVSPVEFKLLFTAPERVAIKAARATDPIVDDFYDIVEDPRLTFVDLGLQSTQDALSYLVSLTLITAERRTEILAGNAQ